METDNIMKDKDGKPVNVPAKEEPNIVQDSQGAPVVPTGVEEPMSQAPVDTLPRPTPAPEMPVSGPEVIQETAPSRAIEKVITFEELAAKKGFGSPDDLAKAYSNLESQNTRVETTLADAIRARQDPEVVETSTEEPATTGEAMDIVNSMIEKKNKVLEDKMDYQMHLMANPDDRQYAKKAIEIVRAEPGIKWPTAFNAARGVESPQVEREQGKQEAYENIGEKTQAQAVQGTTQKEPDVTAQDLIEGIKTGRVPLPQAKSIINNLQ